MTLEKIKNTVEEHIGIGELSNRDRSRENCYARQIYIAIAYEQLYSIRQAALFIDRAACSGLHSFNKHKEDIEYNKHYKTLYSSCVKNIEMSDVKKELLSKIDKLNDNEVTWLLEKKVNKYLSNKIN